MKSNHKDLMRAKKQADDWRRRIRNLAREYVAELIATQDEPDWLEGKGVTLYAERIEFMAELKRITERVRKTVQ